MSSQNCSSENISYTPQDELGNVAGFQASSTVDTIYIVIGTLGIIGNFFVIIVIANGKRMLKKITNLLVLNQSVADFAVALFLMCTSFDLNISSDHILADFICRFWDTKYPLWSAIVTSTYNLVLITLERYLEIVHPIKHKVSLTRGKAKIAMAIVWLFGPIWQSYFFFVSGVTKDKGCLVYSLWPTETIRQVFGVFIVFVQFMVPLFVMIFVYSRIIYVINTRINVANNAPISAIAAVSTGHSVHNVRVHNYYPLPFLPHVKFAYVVTNVLLHYTHEGHLYNEVLANVS